MALVSLDFNSRLSNLHIANLYIAGLYIAGPVSLIPVFGTL